MQPALPSPPPPAPYPAAAIARPPRWRDDLNPLLILIATLGVIGTLILGAGAVEFLIFEPLGQNSGMKARVQGVYVYDPRSRQTSGGKTDHFTEEQTFAAVVDWKSLPSDTRVAAHWYNSFGQEVGGLGPDTAGLLAEEGEDIVPAAHPAGLDKNLPGHYLFVVERYRNRKPVEVIGREIVLVQRGS